MTRDNVDPKIERFVNNRCYYYLQNVKNSLDQSNIFSGGNELIIDENGDLRFNINGITIFKVGKNGTVYANYLILNGTPITEIIGDIGKTLDVIEANLDLLEERVTEAEIGLVRIENVVKLLTSTDTVLTVNGDLEVTGNITGPTVTEIDNRLDNIEKHIDETEHFRGYYATTAEILNISNPKDGDFAWNGQTGTVWAYDKAWGDTRQNIPIGAPPATNTPLSDMDSGVVGGLNTYARGDHVHPISTLVARDNLVVHRAGTETITGNKTFNSGTLRLASNYIYHTGTSYYNYFPPNSGYLLSRESADTITGLKTFKRLAEVFYSPSNNKQIISYGFLKNAVDSSETSFTLVPAPRAPADSGGFVIAGVADTSTVNVADWYGNNTNGTNGSAGINSTLLTGSQVSYINNDGTTSYKSIGGAQWIFLRYDRNESLLFGIRRNDVQFSRLKLLSRHETSPSDLRITMEVRNAFPITAMYRVSDVTNLLPSNVTFYKEWPTNINSIKDFHKQCTRCKCIDLGTNSSTFTAVDQSNVGSLSSSGTYYLTGNVTTNSISSGATIYGNGYIINLTSGVSINTIYDCIITSENYNTLSVTVTNAYNSVFSHIGRVYSNNIIYNCVLLDFYYSPMLYSTGSVCAMNTITSTNIMSHSHDGAFAIEANVNYCIGNLVTSLVYKQSSRNMSAIIRSTKSGGYNCSNVVAGCKVGLVCQSTGMGGCIVGGVINHCLSANNSISVTGGISFNYNVAEIITDVSSTISGCVVMGYSDRMRSIKHTGGQYIIGCIADVKQAVSGTYNRPAIHSYYGSVRACHMHHRGSAISGDLNDCNYVRCVFLGTPSFSTYTQQKNIISSSGGSSTSSILNVLSSVGGAPTVFFDNTYNVNSSFSFPAHVNPNGQYSIGIKNNSYTFPYKVEENVEHHTVVDTDTTQTISNKTIDNSFLSSSSQINSSLYLDPKFRVSGYNVTFPTLYKDDYVVTTYKTQTLIGKTLSAPAFSAISQNVFSFVHADLNYTKAVCYNMGTLHIAMFIGTWKNSGSQFTDKNVFDFGRTCPANTPVYCQTEANNGNFPMFTYATVNGYCYASRSAGFTAGEKFSAFAIWVD